MRVLNYKKLLHSKWTALKPEVKEKHFTIVKVFKNLDDNQLVEWVSLEAVLTKRLLKVNPSELKDETVWNEGWS